MKAARKSPPLRAVPPTETLNEAETPGRAMGVDPLDSETILEEFYRPNQPRPVLAKKERPTHYKIVCISLYNEDIERLEQLVTELKRRGHTKANKSAIIRAALDQIDLAKVPKGI